MKATINISSNAQVSDYTWGFSHTGLIGLYFKGKQVGFISDGIRRGGAKYRWDLLDSELGGPGSTLEVAKATMIEAHQRRMLAQVEYTLARKEEEDEY